MHILTAHDGLFRDSLVPEETGNPAAKEVGRYARALRRRSADQDGAHSPSLREHPSVLRQQRTHGRIINVLYLVTQRLLDNKLFSRPHTKIQHVERELGVSRLTATKYLDTLADGGFLEKDKGGRSNYYINLALYSILTGEPTTPAVPAAP